MKRYNCTSSDKRGAFWLCMEEHEQGAFVPFSEISGLAEQLADATRQCGVMAGLLREAIGEVPQTQSFPSRCDAALAGKLPDRQDTEWTDATTSPVAADYRELQEQRDQLQSKHKAAMELLRETRPSVNYQMGMQRSDTGHREEFAGLLSRIDAMLSGQVPSPAVPEGLHLIYIGEIEVSHKWWINSKSDFFHPSENADFSDWPDGVNKLFRIAASPRQQGGEPCAIASPSSSQA